jgi:hypothetical protein
MKKLIVLCFALCTVACVEPTKEDTGGYSVTAIVNAEGEGQLKAEVAGILYPNIAISGKTSDTIKVVIPDAIGEKLFEKKGVGEIEGALKLYGSLTGEIEVLLATPFGELLLYRKAFAEPTEQ